MSKYQVGMKVKNRHSNEPGYIARIDTTKDDDYYIAISWQDQPFWYWYTPDECARYFGIQPTEQKESND